MVQEPLYVREVTNEIPNRVSPTEAASKLSLSRATIDRLCKQGRLDKIRVSDGRVAITVASIERHLAQLNAPADSPLQIAPRLTRKQQELRAKSAARRQARNRRAA